MNAVNKGALFAIEPQSERFTRWVAETTQWAIRLYWELFVALPVQVISMGTALICFIVGVLDTLKRPGNAFHNLPLICASAAFLLFHRVRSFFWAFLACFIVWLPVEVVFIISLLGEDYKTVSVAANIALVLLCLLPPLVAAAFIDHARHRNTTRK